MTIEEEMTREEAIARIREHMAVHKLNEPRAIRITEALNMAIRALEQESVLDKIRDEIDLETRIQIKHYTNTDAIIDAVLDVIDKYKAESEG